MPAKRPLNPKQLKFVERVIATNDQTQSYIDAYGDMDRTQASKLASRLMKKEEVKALVERGLGHAIQTAELDAAYVIAGLKKEAEFYGRGAQHAARIKAYELLGKAVKVWPEDEKNSKDDKQQGVSVEVVTRILAALGACAPQPAGSGSNSGATVSGDAVVPQ